MLWVCSMYAAHISTKPYFMGFHSFANVNFGSQRDNQCCCKLFCLLDEKVYFQLSKETLCFFGLIFKMIYPGNSWFPGFIQLCSSVFHGLFPRHFTSYLNTLIPNILSVIVTSLLRSWYEKSGIYVGECLIVTFETSESVLSTRVIETQVRRYLNNADY